MSLDALPLLRPLAVLLLVVAFASPLHAAQLVITPSLSIKQEYNDNVFSQVSDRRGDFLLTVAPGLALTRSTERLGASVAGGLSQLLYLKNDRDNATGYFGRGSANFMVNERLSLQSDLSATRETNASSIDPATSLVNNSRTLHQNYRVGESYRLNELLDSSLSLSFGEDNYDNPVYLDTRHYQASAQLGYDLGRYLSGSRLIPQVGLTRDATDQSRVDSLNATLGITRQLSESWQFSVSGGGRYTRSRFKVAGQPEWGTHEEVGALGSLSLAYGDDRRSASLKVSQDLTSASGRSGATQRTGGNLSLYQRFTPRLSGNLGGGYTRNWSGQAEFGGAAIDERYWNAGAGLRYEVGELPSDLALELGYSFNNVDYRITGSRMYQNVAQVRLVWQHASFR